MNMKMIRLGFKLIFLSIMVKSSPSIQKSGSTDIETEFTP